MEGLLLDGGGAFVPDGGRE